MKQSGLSVSAISEVTGYDRKCVFRAMPISVPN
jgi:hypothetical protein